jgi:hypothetical protein
LREGLGWQPDHVAKWLWRLAEMPQPGSSGETESLGELGLIKQSDLLPGAREFDSARTESLDQS